MQSFSFFRGTIPLTTRYNKNGLTLIFSVLVFLLSFVVSCTWLFGSGFHRWGASGSSNLTIEVPVTIVPNMRADQYIPLHNQQVQQVMQTLKTTKGVLDITPVDPEQLKSMLAKWAGETQLNQNFCLPTLFDVKIDPYQMQNITELTQQLRKIAADIRIENHNAWSQKLLLFGHSLQILTLIIGGFILLCVTVIVALITKTSLIAYYPTLDILRLMGAKDSYIARIFQSQIVRSTVYGGIIGILLALPTIYGLVIVLKSLGLGGMMWSSVLWHILIALLLVLVSVVVLSLIISRITVLMCLRRLDK